MHVMHEVWCYLVQGGGWLHGGGVGGCLWGLSSPVCPDKEGANGDLVGLIIVPPLPQGACPLEGWERV